LTGNPIPQLGLGSAVSLTGQLNWLEPNLDGVLTEASAFEGAIPREEKGMVGYFFYDQHLAFDWWERLDCHTVIVPFLLPFPRVKKMPGFPRAYALGIYFRFLLYKPAFLAVKPLFGIYPIPLKICSSEKNKVDKLTDLGGL